MERVGIENRNLVETTLKKSLYKSGIAESGDYSFFTNY